MSFSTGIWMPAKTLREAQSLAALVAASKELRQVWETPSIPAEQKRAVLDAIVAREKISRPVRNFMAVLIDHRRVHFLEPIVKQFEQELNQRLGFTEAEITSARELTCTGARGAGSAGGKADRQESARPLLAGCILLGGAVVQVGSTIYDGSVKGSWREFGSSLELIALASA